MQQRMFRKAAIAVALAALAGCTDKATPLNLTPSQPSPGAPIEQFVNASIDSPNLNITVNDAADANTVGSSLDWLGASMSYGTAWPWNAKYEGLAVGTFTLHVDQLLPSDLVTTDTTTQPLLASTAGNYAVAAYDVAVNFIAGPNSSPINVQVLANPGAEGYGLGQSDIIVADAASRAGDGLYAYYLTDPTGFQNLSGAPIPVSFKSVIDPFLVGGAANLFPSVTSYRLFVVLAASPSTIVFDSGSAVLQPPSSGAMVLGLLDNPNYVPGVNSPFVLYNSQTTALYTDANSVLSQAQFANATDLGGLDVSISGLTPAFPGITNLVSGTPAYSCSIGAGSGVVDFAPTGTGTPNAALELKQAFSASNLLVVPNGAAGTYSTLAFSTDPRAAANEARIRFVNADAANASVNVYITPTGTVSDGDVTSGAVTPAATIAYGQDPNAVIASSTSGTPGPFLDADGTSQPYYEVAGNAGYDIRVTSGTGSSQVIVTESINVTIPAGVNVTEVLQAGTPDTLTQVDNTAASCP